MKSEKKIILVIDDEEILCDILKEELDSSGYEVRQSYGNRDVLDVIRKEKLHLVVSDVRMPNFSGVEVLTCINSLPEPRPKCFLISGYSDLTEEDAKKLNATRLVTKPFSLEDFVKWVKTDLQD